MINLGYIPAPNKRIVANVSILAEFNVQKDRTDFCNLGVLWPPVVTVSTGNHCEIWCSEFYLYPQYLW